VIIALITTDHSHQTNAFEGYYHSVAMFEYHVDDRVRIIFLIRPTPITTDIMVSTDGLCALEGKGSTITGDERGSTVHR